MVTWDTRQNVLLDGVVVTGPDDPSVLSAFDGLSADGATDLSSGLAEGYRLAERNRTPERISSSHPLFDPTRPTYSWQVSTPGALNW